MASKHNIYKQLKDQNVLHCMFVAGSASLCKCEMEFVSPREE